MIEYIQLGILAASCIVIFGVVMMAVGYGLFKKNDDDVTVVSSILTIGGMAVVGFGAAVLAYHAMLSIFVLAV